MKTKLLPVIVSFTVFACGGESESTQTENSDTNTDTVQTAEVADTQAVAETVEEEGPEQYKNLDDLPKYIIAINASEEKEDAQKWVKEQKDAGKEAGFLWIPDYASLSGAKKFVFFFGPYDEVDDCADAVESMRKGDYPTAYGVMLSTEKDRMEIRGKDNITLNGEKYNANAPMVVCIVDPFPDEEASEDWGFFTSDVGQALHKTSIIYTSLMPDEKPDNVKIMTEAGDEFYLDLSEFFNKGTRGYALIQGTRRKFVQHDMPDGVLSEINEFFGTNAKRGD